MRSLAVIAVLATLAQPALAEEPEEEELAEQDEDPDFVLSYDGWFVRMDAGVAYLRALSEFDPPDSAGPDTEMEAIGFGPSLQLAIAARLGRDVTLGGLGGTVHAPATRQNGQWKGNGQGMYFAAAFIDHRLPAKILRLGGGAGGGYFYTVGPNEERVNGVGPVGALWLGIDSPTSARVAIGVVFDMTAGAMRDTRNLSGVATQFDTFMLALGVSFTLRISEPSWPKSFPRLARRSSE
jgi:hypothetical protein